jgi:hypothetical protein
MVKRLRSPGRAEGTVPGPRGQARHRQGSRRRRRQGPRRRSRHVARRRSRPGRGPLVATGRPRPGPPPRRFPWPSSSIRDRTPHPRGPPLRRHHRQGRQAGALPRWRVPVRDQGLGQRPRHRLPRVPRRLRHRHVPPRDQDHLLAAQPPGRHRVRARVRAVARHGGAAARARPAAGVAREPAAARRLRRHRGVAAVRADLHQRAHDARARRRGAARCGPIGRRAAGPGRRPGGVPRRADGAVL